MCLINRILFLTLCIFVSASNASAYSVIRCNIASGMHDDSAKIIVRDIVVNSKDSGGAYFIFSGSGGNVSNHLLLSHFMEIHSLRIAPVPVNNVASAATLLIPRSRDRVAGRFFKILFHNVTNACEKNCNLEFSYSDIYDPVKYREFLIMKNSSIYHNSLMMAQMLDYSPRDKALELLRYHREDTDIESDKALSLGIFREINMLYDEMGKSPDFVCNGV